MSGAATMEVIVDPASGAVQTEPGPRDNVEHRHEDRNAHRGTGLPDAADWLSANRPLGKVETSDAYPGYSTVDAQSAGKVAGVLSVNATTGAVWCHTWQGRFIAVEDA